MIHNSVYSSLCEDDKNAILHFINRSDGVETTESILTKVIHVFVRKPSLAFIDVGNEAGYKCVPPCYLDGELDRSYDNRIWRVLPIHVVLLRYGKQSNTEAEIRLALRFLAFLATTGCSHSSWLGGRTMVDLGLDYVPLEGWTPLGIALIGQCHPSMIEYLMSRDLNNRGHSWFTELLAAILGRQLEHVKSMVNKADWYLRSGIYAKLKHSAWPIELQVRTISLREWKKIGGSVLDFLLTIPGDERMMDILRFLLSPCVAKSCWSPLICRRLKHFEYPVTASPQKADILSKALLDGRMERLEMQSTCWTSTGLLRFMSNLERNNTISTLNLRVPNHLVSDGRIKMGLTRLLQRMGSLERFLITMDEDSWSNTQMTFDALAEAFPECGVRCLALEGPVKVTSNPTTTPISGGSALEKILNSIQLLRFCGVEVQDLFLDFVACAARFSPTLETIVLYDDDDNDYDDLLPPRQHREEVVLHAQVTGKTVYAFAFLVDAFEKYDAFLDKLHVSTAEYFSDLSKLDDFSSLKKSIFRSRVTELCMGVLDPEETPAEMIESVCDGIRSSRNLSELQLEACFDQISDKLKQQVLVALKEAIIDGKLTKLSCPLSLVRHKSAQLASWTKLTRLQICGLEDFGSQVADGSEAFFSSLWRGENRFAEDLIKLAEANPFLVELSTDFGIPKEHTSVLRHRIVCNYAEAQRVYRVENASIGTVLSVLSRANSCKDNEDNGIGIDELARVSATFEILTQSSSIVANWCKENRWRWEEEHELDFALSFMFDLR